MTPDHARRPVARTVDAGVMPYYLHTLDPVTGAADFACRLKQPGGCTPNWLARLPGYMVPRLVTMCRVRLQDAGTARHELTQ